MHTILGVVHCNRPNQTSPVSSDSFSSVNNDITLYIVKVSRIGYIRKFSYSIQKY